MPRSMRLHVASCSFRMLDECACKKPFRFNERDAHEAGCLPFHQARLPKLRAEVAALRTRSTARTSTRAASAASGAHASGACSRPR